jgi:predicted nucleotidyltransferase
MSFIDFIQSYTNVKSQYEFTQSKLTELRCALQEALESCPNKDKITVVATGSYGRNEASKCSDLDLFIIYSGHKKYIKSELSLVHGVIQKNIQSQVGSTGTFGADVVVRLSKLTTNIGGTKDNNPSMTRRMLFLLEGTWLYGEERFYCHQSQVLERYIKSDESKPISRFLLNDIIRYYRTIATDFEYKVSENSKSWGLRNVKLRFSRKILYFAGVVCVAEAANNENQKLEFIQELLKKAPLERVYNIAPKSDETRALFTHYESFLAVVSDPAQRDKLDALQRNLRDGSTVYTSIRDESRKFSKVLEDWLKQQYDVGHPIHNALLF